MDERNWDSSSGSGWLPPIPAWATGLDSQSSGGLSVETPREEPPDADGTVNWLDALDLSEFPDELMEELLADAAEEFPELDIDGDQAIDFLVDLGFADDDLDSAFMPYSIRSTKRVSVPAGTSSLSTSNDVQSDFPKSQGTCTFHYGQNSVWAVCEGKRIIVGKTRLDAQGTFDVGIRHPFKKADLVNEEGASSGVGQGFSMFFHCAACLSVAGEKGAIMEPNEGGDVLVSGYRFEITGRRALLRQSSCDFVLNKYAILALTASGEEFYEEYKALSLGEDTKDHNMYVGTAFDQGGTEYSESLSRIAHSRSQMRPLQLDAIKRNCQRWIMEEVEQTQHERVDHTLNSDSIDSVIRAGGKQVDGVSYYHSPFRVLPPRMNETSPYWTSDPRVGVWSPVDDSRPNEDARVLTFRPGDLTESQIAVPPLKWMRSQKTSFHTIPPGDLDLNIYSRHRACQIDTEREGVSNVFSYHFQLAMNYPVFQYSYLQSELLPKIQGKAGYFYSKHSRTGITWSRSAANSLVWRASYYQFTEPEDEKIVGKWARIGDVWRSPHFTVSRNDIGFASVLPYRMVGTLASATSLLGIQKLKTVVPKLMTWMATVVDSSWRTTELCADSRFLTTVWLSRQKSVQSIIDNQMSSRRELRHCDYLYLTLLKNLCKNSTISNRRLTPLLQLPLQLACLEKDWPLAMQWHIRETSHGLQCMKKIIKAHKLERDWRARHAKWYQLQAEFMERILEQGVSSEEIDELFKQAPEEPAFNAVMYIGMSYTCAGDLRKLGSRGTSSGFNMSGLISDRNCTELKGGNSGHTSKPKKIATCLANLVKNDPDLAGAYEYFVKSMTGPKIPSVFTMHAKDQKSGEREIAQMHFDMRVSQFLAECMSKLYCEVEDTDLMTDPEKYSKVVGEFMDLLGNETRTCAAASEDRTFFCGNFLPEAMGLALYINAIDAGSTGLVSTAALMMRNTRRDVIFPTEFGMRAKEKAEEIACLVEGAELKPALKMSGKKAVKTYSMEMRTHMMQGIYAHTAAVINTTFVKAIAKFQSATMPGMREHVEHTTSDDVGRAASFDRDLPGVAHAKADYCNRPTKVMGHVMMANSERKHMTAAHVIEFNNVMITKSGMVPQAPIHAHLTVQPLTSLSPFNDLMSAMSAATQTLSWGDSPDVAMASVSGAKEVFKQKWIPSQCALGLLDFTEFLPSTLADLVSGFDVGKEQFLNNILHLTPQENIESILRNEMSVANAVAAISIKSQKKVVISRVEGANMLKTFKRRLTATLAARKNATRMNPKYAQPLPVKDRKNTMERLALELMSERPKHRHFDAVLEMISRPNISISSQQLRKSTRRPTKLGSSSRVHDAVAKKVRLWEYAGVQYGEPYDPASVDLGEPREGEDRESTVARFLAKCERKSAMEGKTFKAPGGLPMHQFRDNQLLLKPMAFNFRVELQPSEITNKVFYYKGEAIRSFKFCGWGGKSLALLKRQRLVPAFGWAKFENSTHMYYCSKDGKTHCLTSTASGAIIRAEATGIRGKMVACIVGVDWSPIDPSDFGVIATAQLANVGGDNTAILNYGSYLNSNIPSAFSVMKSIFSSLGSGLPRSAMPFAPAYPTYPQGAVRVPSAQFYAFKGSSCSRRVKLLVDEPSEHKAVVVELNGDVATWEAIAADRDDDEEAALDDDDFLEFDPDIELPSDSNSEEDVIPMS